MGPGDEQVEISVAVQISQGNLEGVHSLETLRAPFELQHRHALRSFLLAVGNIVAGGHKGRHKTRIQELEQGAIHRSRHGRLVNELLLSCGSSWVVSSPLINLSDCPTMGKTRQHQDRQGSPCLVEAVHCIALRHDE